MGKFTDAERQLLLSSPFIEDVTDSQIVFSVKFKTLAVQKNLEGTPPPEIFLQLGLDTALFLPDYPKKCLARWREQFFEEGIEGFEKENRGKGATGRPKKQFKSLEEEVAYLREENDFLKKLRALAIEYQKKSGSR